MPIHWIKVVLRNLADFISTPTSHRWNKSLRKDHWLLQSQFSSQKNQGKPTLWAHLHLNWGKNTKCLFNSELTTADYLIFPVFPSQPLTCQTGINCFHRSPLTFKAATPGAHFHQDLTSTSSRAKLKAPFMDRQLLYAALIFLPSQYLLISKTHQEKWKCDFSTGITDDHSKTIQQTW